MKKVFTPAIQEALLALLCYSDDDGRVVASLVPARYYDPVFREVAEQAIEYWDQYDRAPGEHVIDIYDVIIARDEDRKDLFERMFKRVKGTAQADINGRYVIDRARKFMRFQSLKRGIAAALRGIEKENEEGVEEAEAELTKCLEAQTDVFEPGTSFVHDISKSTAFYNVADDSLPTGIPAIDEYGLGPAPGRLHLFVAKAKSGKSWWLVNLAVRAHQRGKRVLYVTLELSEEETAQRFVQSFFALPKRHADEIVYRKFIEVADPDDSGLDFTKCVVRNVPGIMDDAGRRIVFSKLKAHQDGETLFIKGFAPGTMKAENLEAYLNLLEHHNRFIPDLIIIDYADEMALPGGVERWEGLRKNMQYLKRLAIERSVAVASASQIKVSGAKAKRVDTEHVGGTWDKIALADTVLTYSCTEEEARDNVARVFVAAARTDADKFEVVISQSYATGQFVLSSARLGRHYYAGDSEDEDAR